MSSQIQSDGYEGMQNRRRRRWCVAFVILLALCVGGMAANFLVGAARLPVAELLSSQIFLGIRLPRTLLAAILGGALAVSGFLLQTYFENPLAGPYVLGISAAAKMTVAGAMIFFIGRYAHVSSVVLIVAAFVGAMLATGAILVAAGHIEHAAALLVIGMMIGYICSAVSEFMITFAEEEDIVNLHGWSQGSFSGADMGDVTVAAVVVAVCMAFCMTRLKAIASLRIGEHYAKSVGTNTRRLRVRIIVISGLLSATVAAFAGPISFVGIAVPIVIRKLFLSSEPIVVLPACFFGGAAFTLWCDLIARMAFAPMELSISTVTAIFGAPIVIGAILERRWGRWISSRKI